MRLQLSQIGNWRKMLDAEADALAEASHKATMNRGNAIKNAVRADIRKSRIRKAGAIANTWQGKGFPRSAKAHADKPAYVLGNKFLRVIEQLEKGDDISFEGGYGVVPAGLGLRIVRNLKPGTPRTEFLEEARKQLGVPRLTVQRAKRTNQLQLGAYVASNSGRTRFQVVARLVKGVRGVKLLNHSEIIAREGANFGEQVANDAWPIFEASVKRIQSGGAGSKEPRTITRVG